MKTKDEAARDLIRWHFDIEPDLVLVFRVVSDNESSPEEPIKLLEVNAATVPTGKVEPFAFAAAGDIPYPVVVAEITPAELEALGRAPHRLPSGWDLEIAQRFTRPGAA